MLFIRTWLGLYLILLGASLADRFDFLGLGHGSTPGEIPWNLAALIGTLASWVAFECRWRFGAFFLKILSLLRMLVIILAASIFLAFIIAYVPGRLLWLQLLSFKPS